MASAVSDEFAPTCPWGTSLALVGALAAGLMLGRHGRLALAAGLTAGAGLKWILRGKARPRIVSAEPTTRSIERMPGESAIAERTNDGAGAGESSGQHAIEALPAVIDVPRVGCSVTDEAAPLIWEQGRAELVSSGAVGSQTVWFWHEPIEAIPEVPSSVQNMPGTVPAVGVQEDKSQLPESSFSPAPDGNYVSLPAVPAIAEAVLTATSVDIARPCKMEMSPRFVPQALTGGGTGSAETGGSALSTKGAMEDELHPGPHRSVVPHAPVADRRSERWMMPAMAVALAIGALAVALGVSQQGGWIHDLKFPWQAVRAGALGRTLKEEAATWMTPLSKEEGIRLRSDADAMIR